jgi:hypothetical protein
LSQLLNFAHDSYGDDGDDDDGDDHPSQDANGYGIMPASPILISE